MFFFIKRLIKLLILKWKSLGRNSKIAWSCDINISSTLEGMNRIFHRTTFHGRLGYGSYIGNNCHLSADIGRYTSIAPLVRCNGGRHPYTLPFVTTAPCFFSLNKTHVQNGSTFATKQVFDEVAYYDEERKILVKIGNDCWIGEGAFLVGGIEIGDGAVILAHAVVTKNVPPYAIVGGVPARVLRYRYDDETIAFLQKIQWWNNSPSWFKEHWELLCDMDRLKQYFNTEKR